MEGDQKKKGATVSTSYSLKYAIIDYVGTDPATRIAIRKNNQLTVYVPEFSYRRIAVIVLDTGLSAARVLAISATPCEHCRHEPVAVEVDGRIHHIPRGLITSRRQDSGLNISRSKKRGGDKPAEL